MNLIVSRSGYYRELIVDILQDIISSLAADSPVTEVTRGIYDRSSKQALRPGIDDDL